MQPFGVCTSDGLEGFTRAIIPESGLSLRPDNRPPQALNKPIFGAAYTVTLETGWSLVRTSDKSVAMRKAVKSTYTGGFADSLVGATRLRMAVEGAVRKNIAEGLQAIAEQPI